MKQDYLYTSAGGFTIALTRYGAESFNTRPCILILHGLKGFKDWGFFPYTADYLDQHGFDVITMNFSHNGIRGHGEEFTELELFEHNTLSLEVEETREVIHLIRNTSFLGEQLTKPLGLIGHSRGGGIALLAGATEPGVHAISTWAAVSTFDRYSKETKDEWKRKGFLEVINSRTGQVLKTGKKLLEDVERYSRTSLNILEAVSKLNKPLLVVHGYQDETVPMYEAEQLNIFANADLTTFRVIPGGGHTFGAKHPFEGSNPQLDQVLEITESFFNKYLLST